MPAYAALPCTKCGKARNLTKQSGILPDKYPDIAFRFTTNGKLDPNFDMIQKAGERVVIVRFHIHELVRRLCRGGLGI